MKITCESCQAKYTIADEKVVGKIVKIKCKKCGTTIVVNGNEAANQSPAAAVSASSPPRHEEDADTRVFGNQGLAEQYDEWTVNVTDDDQRTMTAAQVVEEYANGLINGDTYVWRDGMPDWLPLAEVGELMARINGTPSHRPSAQPTPTPLGLGGPLNLGQAAAAGPSFGAARAGASAGAARRAGGRAGGVDVFGAAAQAQEAPSSHPPPHENKAVGERNENSVLFSLSALTAAESAAKKSAPVKDEHASIDLRPSPSRGNNGRAGLDDIMNLGGGGLGGSQMLAPPPMLTPFVEPPPPPPPSMPSPVSSRPVAMGAPMLIAPPPPPKSKVPLVVGAIAGLGLIVGLIVAVSSSSPTPEVPATPEQTVAAAPTAAPTPTETTASPPPTETATPTTSPTAPAVAKASPQDKAAGKVDPKETAKPAETKQAEAPKPEEKPKAEDKPAPAGDGSKEFNRGAASSALGAAAGAAKSCKKPGGPTGSGRARVTFAPSGNVTSASVDGPFSGTPVGACVTSAFKSARVPPFEGSPVAVTKSFSIN